MFGLLKFWKKNIGRAICVSRKIYHWIFLFSIPISRFVSVNTRNCENFWAIDVVKGTVHDLTVFVCLLSWKGLLQLLRQSRCI
jgi:hypothetical protein